MGCGLKKKESHMRQAGRRKGVRAARYTHRNFVRRVVLASEGLGVCGVFDVGAREGPVFWGD